MLAARILWAVEFGLELLGVGLSLRRRNWILLSLFAFCTVSDIALLGIRISFGAYVYAWTSWVQQFGWMLGLSILACQIVGKMVREQNREHAKTVTIGITTFGSLVVMAVFTDGTSIAEQLLDAAMASNLILLLIVALGYLTKRGFLDAEWRMITAGLLLIIGSDLLFTFLWTFWEPARHLYPVGVIPAYGMWNWALKKTEVEKMDLCPDCGRDKDELGEYRDWTHFVPGTQLLCLPKEAAPKEKEFKFSDSDEQLLREMRIAL